jgi:hypothetical protein
VQNAVDPRDLGAATSGATFFRSIGGSFGTAVFGTIFANVLSSKLAHQLGGHALPAGISGSDVSPRLIASLPAALRTDFIQTYTDSLQVVFLVAVPIAFLGFLTAWLLPELRMRRSSGPSLAPDDNRPLLAPDDNRPRLARDDNRQRLARDGAGPDARALAPREPVGPGLPDTVPAELDLAGHESAAAV